ncbi:polyprenyl synthetase family protein [Sulfobacillus acidophilus]|uniref:Polyprenyl synthetase family protein n=1 Tax=Sulfobacillus acidophilus TaxID=53633 RepID=A0ABS3AWE0_9FIRM|nr:polyprenyl synthetase family protein [Sulfobacillus acidophilus]
MLTKYQNTILVINQALEKSLFENQKPNALTNAMAYCLLSSGKRLRPLLLLECAKMARSNISPSEAENLALNSALAIEYVHTYSLIHDDLPSMDNDDFRRGKLACHKKFNQATAILAGDALLSDAFFWLAQAKNNAAIQCFELSKAIGSQGMVLGQIDDLKAAGNASEEYDLANIHLNKTAKLFAASCVLGGLCVDAKNTDIEALREFGTSLGLAFQLIDDVLDLKPKEKPQKEKILRELALKHTNKAISSIISLKNNKNLSEIVKISLKRII